MVEINVSFCFDFSCTILTETTLNVGGWHSVCICKLKLRWLQMFGTVTKQEKTDGSAACCLQPSTYKPGVSTISHPPHQWIELWSAVMETDQLASCELHRPFTHLILSFQQYHTFLLNMLWSLTSFHWMLLWIVCWLSFTAKLPSYADVWNKI